MKKLLIILFLLFSSISNADYVDMPQYDVNGSMTNVNVNARFNALTNVINGGLTNDNAAVSEGFWFIEVLGTLPAAGNQGRVVFVTTTNTLYFDTGTGWVTVATLPSNQTFAGNNTFTGNNTFQGSDIFANVDINDGTLDSVNIGGASQGTATLVSLALNYAHKGDLLYDDGTGKFARLRPNEDNYVLTSQGITNSPNWEPLAHGLNVYTSGSNNWAAPAGITKVYLSMVGGGGSGGSAPVSQNGGGGGSGGGSLLNYPYTVTPGTTYACVVGAGGATVTVLDGDGNPGENTTFNTTIIALGGNGGLKGSTGTGGVSVGGLNAASQTAGGYNIASGTGGNKSGTGLGGGGGGTPFGAGPTGAANGQHGSAASANTGAGGAGGGGEGGNGGAGGSGICIIMY